MTHDYFCTELSEQSIKIADAQKIGTQIKVDAWGQADLNGVFFQVESGGLVTETSKALSELLHTQNVKKKKTTVVIPDTYAYSRFIETPKLHEKELLSAIKYQADQFIPMPLDETSLDIQIIYEDEKTHNTLALVVAAPKKLVAKVEKTISTIGLIPIAIETEIVASARLFSELLGSPNKNAPPKDQTHISGSLIVNMGYNSTSLYFFDTTRSIMMFNHTFPIGFNLFLKVIQVNLNVDRKTALQFLHDFKPQDPSAHHLATVLTPALKDILTEIQRSTTLLNEKYNAQITNVYMYNAASSFGGIAQIVEKYLSVPTKLLDLSALVIPPPATTQLQSVDPNTFVCALGGNLK